MTCFTDVGEVVIKEGEGRLLSPVFRFQFGSSVSLTRAQGVDLDISFPPF